MRIRNLFLVAAAGATSIGCGGVPASKATASQGARDNSGWCHKRVQASDSALFSFEYQVARSSDHNTNIATASPAWLNVKIPGASGNESVRAVVTVFSHSGRCGVGCPDTFFEDQHQLDMSYENGRFTASVPAPLISVEQDGSDDWTQYQYDVAVVVDGKWYKGSDGKDSVIDLADQTNLCGNDPAL